MNFQYHKLPFLCKAEEMNIFIISFNLNINTCLLLNSNNNVIATKISILQTDDSLSICCSQISIGAVVVTDFTTICAISAYHH